MMVTSEIFENTLMIEIPTHYSVITPSTQPGPKKVSYEPRALDYKIKACSPLALLSYTPCNPDTVPSPLKTLPNIFSRENMKKHVDIRSTMHNNCYSAPP